MNEECASRLSFVISKFRSGLALDAFECRDFSFVIYFISYLAAKERQGADVDDWRFSGFEGYLCDNRPRKCSELSLFAASADEYLEQKYFLFDVVSGFTRRPFGDRADEVIRTFCREIFEFVSQEEVFLSAGDYFEFLIKILSENLGKRAGEDYTPRSLVELMVNIVQPKAGESVYDPVCGSGGFLVAANRYSLEHGDKKEVSLKGREINFSASRLARMNCYLHACSDFSVETESSLQSVELGSFDVVLANPPFSMPLPGSDLLVDSSVFEFGEPPKSNADYAFLQVIVKSLKKTGRAAVVAPQGVLFRGGVEGEIRRSMILAGLFDSVISLPSNMLVNTAIPISILVLRGAPAGAGGVLFVDAAAAFEQLRISGEGVRSVEDAVINICRHPRDIEGVSKLVGVSVIEENGFNLNLARYISPLEEEKRSFDELLKKQHALEIELDSLQKEFYRILRGSH